MRKIKCLDGHVERNCPICGNKSTDISANVRKLNVRDTKLHYKIFTSSCNNCKIYYQAPILPETFFNEMYGNYVGNSKQQKLRYDTELINRKRSALSFSRYIKNNPDFSILEIGCSSGYNLENIRKRFDKVKLVGVDIDEDSIEYGKTRGNDLYAKDAFTLNEKFNVVFLNHVFEHINDPITFIIKLKELVKDGGIIAINVPNSYEWSKKNWLKLGFRGERPSHEHVNYFSEEGLENLIKKAGYTKYYIQTDIIHDELHKVPEIRLIIEL